MRVEPAPTPEEAAAILAALEVLREGPEELPSRKRSRWKLAGMLGCPVPDAVKLEGSLWSYRGWKG